MIPKCSAITNASQKLRSLFLITVFKVFRFADGARLSSECKNIVIGSTIGTFAVCAAFAVGLVIYVSRRSRKHVMRESQRKMVVENGGSLHFQNEMTISQVDEPDSGIESTPSPNPEVSSKREVISEEKNTSARKVGSTDMGTQTSECHMAAPKHELVILEKRQNGGVGLNLAMAGLYVKNVCSDLVLRSGCCLEPGDEILSINGRQVEGMSDMEALALLAKSGSTVLLEIVKKAFIGRVYNVPDASHQPDMKKRSRLHSPLPGSSNEAALKKARIEIDEALMELRRTSSTSHKSRENSSPCQSLTSSVEVQNPIAEEDFVVIENDAIAGIIKSTDKKDQKEAQSPNAIEHVAGKEKILRQPKCDENENVVPRTVRSRSHLGISSSNSTSKISQVDQDNDIKSDEVLTRDSNRVAPSIGSPSKSIDVTYSGQYSRKELSLPSKFTLNPARKTSPPGDQNRYLGSSPPSKSSSTIVDAVIREPSPNIGANVSFYVGEDSKIISPMYANQIAQSSQTPNFDLDKIKPPPSYEIASQIFNSQRHAAKSSFGDSITEGEVRKNDSMDSEGSYQGLINEISSQHSSFDDVEAMLPTMITKSGRDQIAIDEHVMRYMTKKYSEPRITTPATHYSPVAGTSNGSRLGTSTLSLSQASLFRRSPVAMSERQINIKPLYTVNGNMEDPGSHSNGTEQQIIARDTGISQVSSNILHHTVVQSDATGSTLKAQLYSPQTELPRTIQIPRKTEIFPGTNAQVSRNGDQMNKISTEVNLDAESVVLSQPRKGVSIRTSRLYRQKGFSVENIRRATSSPSVNSEHERNDSSESQNGVQFGKRARAKRYSRDSQDESFDRRKSIDSGSLRKLAAELQANQSLSDDLPMLSRLLGGTKFQDFDKQNKLYRYRSSDALYGNF